MVAVKEIGPPIRTSNYCTTDMVNYAVSLVCGWLGMCGFSLEMAGMRKMFVLWNVNLEMNCWIGRYRERSWTTNDIKMKDEQLVT